MRWSRRRSGILVAPVIVAIALIVGVGSVAGAGSSGTLPQMAPEEILATMAQSDLSSLSVSGEISWRNDLFGTMEMPSDLAQIPAQSPLLSSGSGRLWASRDGVRIESQGSGGDEIATVSRASRTAWVFDSAANTARRYELTGEEMTSPSSSPSAGATLAPVMAKAWLQRLSLYATVEVAGQEAVAGRSAYLLRMTPLSDDTALGYVQAAVDGETMLPLRLEVFARGYAQPTLRLGFDTISYADVDASLFEFTPPDGTDVKTKTIDPSKMRADGERDVDAGSRAGARNETDKARRELARRALLTMEQAQRLVDYDLARARDYAARPFRWAYVFADEGPLTARGEALLTMAGQDETTGLGRVTALLYGSGFGAITLLQTRTTPELTEQLKQLPVLVQTEAGGSSVRSIFTPLGGAVVWQQGETTLLAAGLVTQTELEEFVDAVR